MTYDEIIAELDWVTTMIATTDPTDENFDYWCAQQEALIRQMNSHPDKPR